MTLQIILLILGLAMVVFGADWFVDGASAIARKAGISEFVIGLTIVGFGTSCPELVVSLTGAIQGNADISIGNVVGSNIFNTLFILGLTALVAPIAVTSENRRKDIPIALMVTFAFLLCGILGGVISRVEGIIFLLVFAAYLIYCFKSGKSDDAAEAVEEKVRNIWLAILLVILGLAGLIAGGDLFVNNAVAIARELGVSDKFIAITLLAGGTSMPELATCIVASAKHKDQLALGNILGSNVFNILLIIGSAAVVTPLSFANITMVDSAVLAASALFVWIWTFTGRKDTIDRWEGALMTACFVGYYVWLFVNL